MIGVPGNIAVIFFIVRHFKMDNFTVHLMLNLAAADILCLITLPVWIYNQLYSWSIGQSSCKFFAALVYCSAYSSVITVTMLSVYRCLQIRHPQLWSRMSKRRERALLISGWALALLFSCPSVLAQEIVQSKSKKSCGRILHSEEYRLTAAILEMLLAFFLPFTIILTSYCCLHQKVTQGTFSHRQRLTKLVTRIVVTFFIFYAPHQIINLFQIFEIIRSSTGDIYNQRDMLFTEESFSSVNRHFYPLQNVMEMLSKQSGFWMKSCSYIWLMLLSKATYIVPEVHILSGHTFPGNQTHDLDVTTTMFYCLSYRKFKGEVGQLLKQRLNIYCFYT
uniref:G-protein coupled receptors family 1 profile domain-containing protein n=1 Tax=Sinocyclocheilus rhinocerous TaxID=307959 RepID=A0A673FVB4_9TELE